MLEALRGAEKQGSAGRGRRSSRESASVVWTKQVEIQKSFEVRASLSCLVVTRGIFACVSDFSWPLATILAVVKLFHRPNTRSLPGTLGLISAYRGSCALGQMPLIRAMLKFRLYLMRVFFGLPRPIASSSSTSTVQTDQTSDCPISMWHTGRVGGCSSQSFIVQ